MKDYMTITPEERKLLDQVEHLIHTFAVKLIIASEYEDLRTELARLHHTQVKLQKLWDILDERALKQHNQELRLEKKLKKDSEIT